MISKLVISTISYPFVVIWNFFLDIFFPIRCVECGNVGHLVCFDCAKKIEKIITSLCPLCGKINKYGSYCPNCKIKAESNLTGLIVAADYTTGPTKEMIHHLKYSGLVELADMLGELMVERLKYRLPRGKIVVIPVPLHSKREGERGYNQAELLARYISKRLRLSGGLALRRIKNTQPQVKLSGQKRRQNLIGMFECIDKELIKDKVVLLVDDVTTTNSTLNECAKMLRSAGARQVWGVVVARR